MVPCGRDGACVLDAHILDYRFGALWTCECAYGRVGGRCSKADRGNFSKRTSSEELVAQGDGGWCDFIMWKFNVCV
jgi:hypothetical protein